MTSLLSIIIINYNTFSLTCKCIESILQYTQEVSYEIILVDNASTECSPDKFLELFPQITLIKSPENVGFAKGNNLGLQYAKGEYILLLNSDIELNENSIAICLQKMQENPQIGVISPLLVYPDGKVQHTANKFHNLTYEFIELFRLHKILGKKRLLGFYFSHNEEIFVDWVWGAFFLIRREVIDKMPARKLPDDFFMYFEDVQWCYLIRKLGYKILFTPATRAIHYVSASSQNTNPNLDKFEKSLQNETQFWLKEKGWLYTKMLYFVRAIKYFSLRKKEFRQIAKLFWKKFLKF
ncbi:glycosyltransferase family 2 protein [Raineya orbicola]|uniref:Putative glycosyltransferase n=1 Tax=Raineya orbicola TaxID=2016530 RepID=A0A2N3IKL9_9BACT|nr:glycosyltransferase family 2 protein [Raineya orbicola]PKQ70831.1 putative glycosyltransferase [Raineya orbicola]